MKLPPCLKKQTIQKRKYKAGSPGFTGNALEEFYPEKRWKWSIIRNYQSRCFSDDKNIWKTWQIQTLLSGQQYIEYIRQVEVTDKSWFNPAIFPQGSPGLSRIWAVPDSNSAKCKPILVSQDKVESAINVLWCQEIGSPELKLRWQFQLYDCDRSGEAVMDYHTMKMALFNDIPGNINQEEFVEIFLQIFEGEDTGEPKTT